MRLQALRSFLRPIILAIALALPPAFAQSPGDAELKAMNSRIEELLEAGNYNEAMPLAERYLTAAAARYGENAPEYATGLNNLAALLYATNRLTEAEPLFRRALDIDEKSFGPDHPEVATALDNLATLLKTTNRYAEAEPLVRRALRIYESKLGPDHPQVAINLGNLAQLLQDTNRYAEAEPLMRRALAVDEKRFGPSHPNTARDLNNLAQLLQATNRLTEAEPLMRRALAIDEKSLGPDHPDLARDLNNLAQLLQATNRYAEAEPLMRRALKIDEASSGPDQPSVGRDLSNLASLLEDTNRFAEAEPLMRRALKIDEASLGPEHPNVAIRLNNLAHLLQATNRLSEAEPLMRRALAIDEKSFGPDHSKVAIRLNNLAQLLRAMNRLSEAEPLMRRALKIDEASLGPDHPNVATDLDNLAIGLEEGFRKYGESEQLKRRALTIDEASFGPNHPKVAIRLNNLSQLLRTTHRYAEAEPLMRRALAINEKSLGPDHPNVATAVNNLAELLMSTNRLTEAEPLMRRALAIDEKSLGPDHPDVARDLDNMAALLEDQSRWLGAVVLHRKAKLIMTGAHGGRELESGGLGKAVIAENAVGLKAYVRSLYRAGASDTANLAEGFESAQLALQNDAADALSAMAARFAKGGEFLAKLVREQQDLLRAREAAYRNLDTAAGNADARGAEAARATIAQIETRIEEKQAALRQAFPDYAELANPKPLPLADAQALLGERDALVLFLDLPQIGKVPEESIVFVLTKKEALWTSISLGTRDLRERVAALRCGLDGGAWRDESRQKCHDLIGAEPRFDATDEAIAETLPFDLARSRALYRELFGGVEDLIQGKRLLIVPSGALTQLPFEVLVTRFAEAEKYGERIKKAGRLGVGLENITSATGVKIAQVVPGAAAEKAGLKPNDIILSLDGQAFDNTQKFTLEIQSHKPGTQVSLRVLRDGSEITLQATLGVMEKREWIPRFVGEYQGGRLAWLGQRQAITILPSVGSLKALSAARASTAPEPFAGFGNPLLTGVDGADKSAWTKQECGKPAAPKPSRIASLVASIASQFRGGAVSVEALRRQPPLPETADELCAVGRELGVPEAGLSKAIHLGGEATVTKVKALSASGDLARARVVHFATHGLLAGETALFAKAKAESALLLTPPAEASENDNGLLTASEVAQLKLNADWVVLSACNTAAGSAEGAEALSGLARAFFYAGARSLLVTHWPVDSEAAVAITTGAVNAMKANPKIGRAEALRSAEAALIARGGRFAHPTVWAPFVLVGNGGQ